MVYMYIVFSCALGWSVKGKAKEVQLTLCWSLLFLRLHSRFSPIQERSPKFQGNGRKPLGHPFNCPAIAGNHSIKVFSIT